MAGSAVLLIGSPRGKRGVSHQLAAYLSEQLSAAGLEVTTLSAYKALRSDSRRQELLAAVNGASVMGVVTPLYIDCLPANVIRTLELIASDRATVPAPARARLAAVVNCGFLESHHNNIAIRILERFAAEAGFDWAGGLAVGGGGTFEGRPLQEVGPLALDMMQALELSATALAAGQAIPQEAQALVRKQRLPRWLYMLGGNAGWWILARQHGTMLRIRARPYAKH